MQQRNIGKEIWEVFSPIVLKIAVSFGVELLVVSVFCVQYLPELGAATTQNEMMSILMQITEKVYQYIVEITGIAALATIPFLVLMKKNDERKELAAGLVQNWKAPLSKYVLVAGISIPFALGLNNILLLSNLAEYSIAYQEASEALYTPSLLVQIICLGIITPIMEELIFRGLIFKRIRRIVSAKRAIIASALFFGLYHGNLVQTIYGILCGLLLGYLYEKFGSLKAPIFAHMLMNIVACVLTEADVFTWMFSESIRMAVITILCAALASSMFLFIQKIGEQEEPAEEV